MTKDYSKPLKILDGILLEAKANDAHLVGYEEPADKLNWIERTITSCVRGVKVTFLHIGGLLKEAKELCAHHNELNWNEFLENLGFSDDTARNFIAAWNLCEGNPQLAQEVKPSVLYIIGAPSFPDELRQALLKSDSIGKYTGVKDVKEHLKRFNENGEIVDENLKTHLNSARERKSIAPMVNRLQGASTMLARTRETLTSLYGPADSELLPPKVREMREIADNALVVANARIENALKRLKEEAGSEVDDEVSPKNSARRKIRNT